MRAAVNTQFDKLLFHEKQPSALSRQLSAGTASLSSDETCVIPSEEDGSLANHLHSRKPAFPLHLLNIQSPPVPHTHAALRPALRRDQGRVSPDTAHARPPHK